MAETATTLATWFYTRWTKALEESVWPDADDLRLVSIRNLTDLSSTDGSQANRSAVAAKLYKLPLATLQAERDRQANVVKEATETFVDQGTQTVTSPNLPDPNPLGSILAGLWESLKPVLLPAAAIVAGLWYLSTKGKSDGR